MAEGLRSCPTEFRKCLLMDLLEVITKWVFSNGLQPAVDFHKLLSRTNLKAFLLTLTYNFITRFVLYSSSAPLLFPDIYDLELFNLILPGRG